MTKISSPILHTADCTNNSEWLRSKLLCPHCRHRLRPIPSSNHMYSEVDYALECGECHRVVKSIMSRTIEELYPLRVARALKRCSPLKNIETWRLVPIAQHICLRNDEPEVDRIGSTYTPADMLRWYDRQEIKLEEEYLAHGTLYGIEVPKMLTTIYRTTGYTRS